MAGRANHGLDSARAPESAWFTSQRPARSAWFRMSWWPRCSRPPSRDVSPDVAGVQIEHVRADQQASTRSV